MHDAKPAAAQGQRRRPRRRPTSRASSGSKARAAAAPPSAPRTRRPPRPPIGRSAHGYVEHGSVVIAAITSCTNTSNPSVMIAAGLLAKKAVEQRPDDEAVGQDEPGARLEGRDRLPRRRRPDAVPRAAPVQPRRLRLHHLHRQQRPALAGDRQGDRRRRPRRRGGASAATATSRAGSTPTCGPTTSPRRRWSSPTPWPADGHRPDHRAARQRPGRQAGLPQGHLADPGARSPTPIRKSVRAEMFDKEYGEVFEGDERWQSLPVPEGDLYAWDADSTYVKHPPYFEDMPDQPAAGRGDHGRPRPGRARRQHHDRPHLAGRLDQGPGPGGQVPDRARRRRRDFNSYGSRRGNHEVMVRGTFANIRLKNLLAPGTEGGVTRHLPDGEVMSIFDASVKYHDGGRPADHPRRQGVRLGLVARLGGQGAAAAGRPRGRSPRATSASTAATSSAWASCRCSSGAGDSADDLGLTGEEVYGSRGWPRPRRRLRGRPRDHRRRHQAPTAGSTFDADVRIDTPQEIHYYQHGGILQYVLRQLLGGN